jgi:hypothetical protein
LPTEANARKCSQAPVVALVASGGVDDIRAQLREAEEEVELQAVQVSMHRPEEVARAVRQVGDARLVASRGEGARTFTTWTRTC